MIVVGAGAAGLAAAVELEASGLDVIVLEARRRCGGRVWTLCEEHAPVPIELGAEFVHGDAPSVESIAHERGLAMIELDPSHWRRGRAGLEEAPSFEAMLGRAMRAAAKCVKARPDRSFLRALDEARVRDPARAHALAYVEGFNAAFADRVSARALAGEDLGRERSRRVLSGYEAIIDALRGRLAPPSIRVGRVVREIEWSRSRVTVRGAPVDGSAAQSLRATRVLVTVPLNALKEPESRAGIRFVPALAAKSRAAAKLDLGCVIKIVFLFRTAFWEDASIVRARRGADLSELGFVHAPDEPFPTWWTLHPVKASVMTAWVGGSKAAALESFDEPRLVSTALASLANALGVPHARTADELVRWWRHDWTRDPFARGAYSYPLVGGARAGRALAAPVESTVFFAGEATCDAPHNGTVHGALDSGRRAAREILASMRRGRAT